jgi:hypothetical protein
MTITNINIGTIANDGTGDPLRQAFDKINDNFSELYARGAAGSNFDLSDNDIEAINSNGGINLIPNGTGKVVVEDDSVTVSISRTIANSVGSAGDTAGMIAWNSSHIYVCTANYDGSTAIWRRATLGSW